MPSVPLAQNNSVRDEALPGARVKTRAPIEAFGGGESVDQLNKQAHGLNDDAMDLAIKIKQQADDVVLQDADLQASMAQTDVQLEASKLQGKNANGAPDYVNDEWKKRTEKIKEGLSNEAQRQRFDKILKVRSADLYKFSQQHVSTENQKYDTQLTEAYLANSQTVAANNYLDVGPGGSVDQSVYMQQEALKKYGERHGIPDELIKQQIATSTSKTYVGVINQMLANKDDQSAAAYYKEIKDGILPADRKELETTIEKGILLGDAQREADKVFEKYADNRNQAFDYTKNKIKDPELRKETENQLERMYTRQNLARREANVKNYQLASEMVEQNQQPPATLTTALNAEQNAALTRRLKQVNAGVQPNTDWATYYQLKTMAANNKNEFARENLMQYRHILGDTEFKDLTNLQGQVAKNDEKAQTVLNGFRTNTQIVYDTLSSAGINTKSKRPADIKRVADFQRQVDENVQALQEQTGKKVKSEEVQKIADNLLITAISKRPGLMGMFDREKKIFELEYKDVPDEERSKIMRAMKQRGMAPTERSILEWYSRGMEMQKGGNAY